jgi:hypothetical protein
MDATWLGDFVKFPSLQFFIAGGINPPNNAFGV